jgi:hypothetical protein
MASSKSFTAFGYNITVFKVPYRGQATTCQVDYRTTVAGAIAPKGFPSCSLGTSETDKELTLTIPAGGNNVGGYVIIAAVRPG